MRRAPRFIIGTITFDKQELLSSCFLSFSARYDSNVLLGLMMDSDKTESVHSFSSVASFITGASISPTLIAIGTLGDGVGESSPTRSIASTVIFFGGSFGFSVTGCVFAFLVSVRMNSGIAPFAFLFISFGLGFNFMTTATESFRGSDGIEFSPGQSILLVIIGASRWIPHGSPMTIGNNKRTLTIPVLSFATVDPWFAVLILRFFWVSTTRACVMFR
mmetsp:Transcript_25075/g.59182  ORF Transcript_25075/g.59182 Transcript_25075/m.59182 type:complete len:218 (-) Transcript_25075:1260-1913(-)